MTQPSTFTGRLFGPGLEPGGVGAQAHFAADTLVLAGAGRRLAVPVAWITARSGGYDGRQWTLAWDAPEGAGALVLEGAAAMAVCRRTAPAALAARLAQAGSVRARAGLGFRLALAAIALTFVLPLILLGAFWLNADRISRWAADQVSIEQEMQLGELAFAQMRPGLEWIESGPAFDAVQRIGARLTTGSRYRFRFHLARDARVNAFALPGGHVVVFTGLMRVAGDGEELAGVLAHEASHVLARHSLRNLVHALGWRAVLALGDVSGGVFGDVAGTLGSLGYGRDLEREADRMGLDLLRRAAIHPAGMERFFERMARRAGEPIALLSSHPASAERLAALRAARAGAYPVRPLAVDWAAVRRSLPTP